jgi:hypothetical protein
MSPLIYLVLFILPVIHAQNTTTPTPWVRGPCIYHYWNDTFTFSWIIAVTVIFSFLLAFAIGFGVEQGQKKNWNFKFPWSKVESDYMYKPVIIAPIPR